MMFFSSLSIRHTREQVYKRELFRRDILWRATDIKQSSVEGDTARGTTTLVYLQLHISLYTVQTLYMYCEG